MTKTQKYKSLWFKQIYVGDILAGRKTDTIRSPESRPYAVGDLLRLSVGPRSPFATAMVVAWDVVNACDLGERLNVVRGFYGNHSNYRRLTFRLLHVYEDCPEVIKAAS